MNHDSKERQFVGKAYRQIGFVLKKKHLLWSQERWHARNLCDLSLAKANA